MQRAPLLGIFPSPRRENLSALREQVQIADLAGLDLVGIQDHPYEPSHLDAWTLLAHLSGCTERVRFVTDVANLPLRSPALLAKSAASLSILSGGRVELGLGAGANWKGVATWNGPVRTGPQSVDALEEAIEIIRLVWSAKAATTFEGHHYSLRDANPGPAPEAPIGIWIGGYGPRMMRVIGRLADGWMPSLPRRLPLADIPAKQAAIDEAARAAGRVPSAILRVANISGTITDGKTGDWLTGPPSLWAQELAKLVRLGFDGFIFSPPGEDVTGQTRRFAEEVAPLVHTTAG